MIGYKSENIIFEFVRNLKSENVYDYNDVNKEFNNKCELESSMENIMEKTIIDL